MVDCGYGTKSGVRKKGERIEAFQVQVEIFFQTEHLTEIIFPHLLVLSPFTIVENNHSHI